MSMHVYRGFEIHPLIYPHVPAGEGRGHNYEAGFDAAVRICPRSQQTASSQGRIFKLADRSPFSNAGDARRASLLYAEEIIDRNEGEHWVFTEAG
ncbi:hypothetical protein [Burkholderia oklahomensis]|uniref:Uncharacterized protein n=1 Tax=Burkholderia oklahomensis TaxID=342113 RepID=A0AAI8BA95_9BURK|nr:hypothetical protein [Burkholderia oklahomensis]AIO68354.1 hypothetical protein DM82_491 [Burkholderia oklahomensis]AOI43137.1 hypothetical protein WG70_26855 [Burkholderia oklahomensis EO147]KUY57845.1 hypothetical protein WG70_08520 [Burkholderia oklahomensis EO147]QPS37880.1 hypothetical protein I6G57_03215 [Burkholderia oklahomensis]